jgi:hypothetical protein
MYMARKYTAIQTTRNYGTACYDVQSAMASRRAQTDDDSQRIGEEKPYLEEVLPCFSSLLHTGR